MRRIISSIALAVSVAFAPACGDDKPATENDTSTGTDTTTGDDSATNDDTAVSTDTTTPVDTSTGTDTTTPVDTATNTDTSTPIDDGTGLCTGIVACAAECLSEACNEACRDAADSAFELTAFTDFILCLDQQECVSASNPPTSAERKAAFECQRTKCMDATVACQQGETAGTGACPALGGCVSRCEDDDLTCARACYTAATATAASQFLDLNLCISAECIDSRTTPAEFEACATQAQRQQPCSLYVSQCFGNIGAAPSEGAGGGFGGDAFRFFGK